MQAAHIVPKFLVIDDDRLQGLSQETVRTHKAKARGGHCDVYVAYHKSGVRVDLDKVAVKVLRLPPQNRAETLQVSVESSRVCRYC